MQMLVGVFSVGVLSRTHVFKMSLINTSGCVLKKKKKPSQWRHKS